MTQTIQSRSLAVLSETGKDLIPDKPGTEDNARLLLTICDSLNELYEKLNRLSYLMDRRIVEHNLHLRRK